MDLFSFVFLVIVVLYSVIIHEIAHGAIANSLGDPTAKNLGRLTLNPLKHIDLFGSILLPIMTLGRFGYAKPVPYNPNNLTDREYGPLKVALAGPLANIMLAVIFGLVLRFLSNTSFVGSLRSPFEFITLINLGLAVFNLLPIPPLDGHWLLFKVFPTRFFKLERFFAQYGIVVLILILVFFIGPIIYARDFLFRLITGYSAGM